MFPKQEQGFIGYYAGDFPFPDEPPGYPPVYVTGQKEWHALMEINKALRVAFPGDMILVLVPPTPPLRPPIIDPMAM
jgi:hypothetical protein